MRIMFAPMLTATRGLSAKGTSITWSSEPRSTPELWLGASSLEGFYRYDDQGNVIAMAVTLGSDDTVQKGRATLDYACHEK